MIRCKIKRSKQNPFGPVQLGILNVKASCIKVALTFRGINSGKLHGQQEYFLVVMTKQHEKASQRRLSFFADYIYHDYGLYELYKQDKLALLLTHPRVALVLRQQITRPEYLHIDGEPTWERIGIARLSREYEYGGNPFMDWTIHTELGSFNVV
ncbi:hypothetical protein CC86DRAFT_21515 [Ophiobolus disseminans]|uniref:Uncharacterized protein n=1 Tax=Ophiobolus disseminans TaxID=1469910 RepID=A0A6A7A2C5_9PLEO|nr:hypothetical protein CC86DRAFT_21515 [Ophiobolus disseminans]